MRSETAFPMTIARRYRAIALALALSSVMTAAAGGGAAASVDDDAPAATSTSADQGTPTIPPATPVPHPTEPPPTDAQLAYHAAIEHFDAVSWDKCEAAKNPEMKNCVMLNTDPATPPHGIAVFPIGSPLGGGVLSVFGRTPDGTWQFWFATQNVMFRRVSLPGYVRVCAGGDRLNVRTEASAQSPVVAQLAADAVVNVSDFVLTEPFEASAARQGAGWYRLADGSGWIYSCYLSDASLSGCAAHDAIEGAG